ncbi:MAG TPA: flavodoxin family protein [Candidatus Tripitaka californicus]|uniref:flavodoxin family protein n=1 Tax=Candidatus Tripitaka californicus TaxID=3367616 RepID=UPI004026BDD0|nr:flavodoxin family protein [Planctomycetota bacterium]
MSLNKETIIKKKLLAIAGSPRRGGNTDLLLQEALRAANQAGVDTLLLRVSELKISPCTACGACWKSGECVQQDDMQTVYAHLLDSHYIVIASPLYFMGVSAQLKALIDRCQALWARRYMLKKELRNDQVRPGGLFISVAALNKGDKIFAGSIQTVKALFHVLGVEYKGEILCCGLEEKGAIQSASGGPELLEKVHQATLQLFEPLAQPALTRPS